MTDEVSAESNSDHKGPSSSVFISSSLIRGIQTAGCVDKALCSQQLEEKSGTPLFSTCSQGSKPQQVQHPIHKWTHTTDTDTAYNYWTVPECPLVSSVQYKVGKDYSHNYTKSVLKEQTAAMHLSYTATVEDNYAYLLRSINWKPVDQPSTHDQAQGCKI